MKNLYDLEIEWIYFKKVCYYIDPNFRLYMIESTV